MDKILIVEDDKSIITGLVYYFKKEGFQVHTAQSANEARHEFLDKIFDVIILDVGLGNESGFDLAKEFREISKVPIIFLTAMDESEHIIEGFEAGGDDYITKPFSVRELFLRVASILKRAKIDEKFKVLESACVMLNIQDAVAFKDGKEIDLTPTELNILTLLMFNPREALSRDEILKNLWQTNEDLKGDNTVSVYMKRLREKLEEDSSKPDLIKTIRNAGYIWDNDVKRS